MGRRIVISRGGMIPNVAGGGGDPGFTGSNGFSATGTFTEGSTITVSKSGGGLGTGPTISVYDRFRGGTVGNDVQLTSPTLGVWDDDGGNGQLPKYHAGGRDGSTCARFHTDPCTPDQSISYGFQRNFSSCTEIMLSYAMRCTLAEFSNIKELWHTKGGSTGTNDVCFATPGGNDMFFFGNHNGFRVDMVGGFDAGGNWDNSGWVHRRLWMKADSGSINSHVMCAVSQRTAAGQLEKSRHSSDQYGTGPLFNATGGWDQVFVPGFWNVAAGNTDAPPLRLDDVLIQVGANAAQMFVLTNSATWTAGGGQYDCPHTSWADGSASIMMPYTEWGALTGKHLWYFDADNNRTYCGVFV